MTTLRRMLAAMPLLSLCVTFAAQLPPPPAVRDEPRSPAQIGGATACGVRVGGKVELGRTTSGAGQLVFSNESPKPVAAIAGEMIYETGSGSTSYPWTHSYLGGIARARAFLPPGKSSSVPPTATNVTTPTDFVKAVRAQVTGVVFADGTTCGARGESLRKYLIWRAGAARLDLEKVTLAFQKLPASEFEKLVKAGILKQGEMWLNLVLQHELLDENGRLRADVQQRLEKLAANLEKPLDTP